MPGLTSPGAAKNSALSWLAFAAVIVAFTPRVRPDCTWSSIVSSGEAVGSEGNYRVTIHDFPKVEQVPEVFQWFFNGMDVQSYLYDGITYNLTKNESGYSSKFSASELWINSTLSISYLRKEDDNVEVKATYLPCPARATVFISVRYCPNLDKKNITGLLEPNTSNAVFAYEAQYTCEEPGYVLVVDDKYDKNVTSFGRFCQANANWTKDADLSCWNAPVVNMKVESSVQEILDDGTVVSGYRASLFCVESPGIPILTEVLYYLNGSKIPNISPKLLQLDFTVNSSYHNVIASCQAYNKYVREVEPSSGKSNNLTLKVWFGPEDNGNEDSLQAELGKEFFIVMNFTANPPLALNDTSLKLNGTSVDTGNDSLNNEGIYHKFTRKIEQVKDIDLGKYQLTAHSSEALLSDIMLTINVTLKAATYKPASPSTVLVPVICAVAGFLVLVLLVFLVWKIIQNRRQNPKDGASERASQGGQVDGSGREERANPLYGVTPNAEREERVNPLYGSSSGAAVEEATYSEVKKDKKAKKKGIPF